MRLCRFDNDRLGVVLGDEIADVTEALDVLPSVRWPVPLGDLLIQHLDEVVAKAEGLLPNAARKPRTSVKLLSPVANPTKVIGAPVNYQLHIDEANADKASFGQSQEIKSIDYYGPFLKANTSLIGADEPVEIRFPDRRNDHEVELAVIIGKTGTNISYDDAMDYVAGYAIGLDMTVRGTEDRSVRKSLDTYSVLGPWLVTKDEIADPDKLDFWITVNNEIRQKSNTSYLIYDVRKQIEYFSSFYTLVAGDVIMTGTPEGVGPVKDGDTMVAEIEGIGRMEVAVRNA